MAISITYHDGIEDHFRQHGFDLAQLTSDLDTYFSSNKSRRPYYLGKDAPFERPENIKDSELHHIHIFVQGITVEQAWKNTKNPQYRTSDSYLVYTFGFFDADAYHVLGFIEDGAHDKCKSNDNNYKMVREFKYAADAFRDKF